MLYYVVIATKRDWSEAIISLHRDLENARQVARRLAVALSQKVVRCRIKPMGLSRSQIEAICFDWGFDDALDGEPLLANKLSKPFATAYRHGYRVGKHFARPEGQI